MMRQVAAENLQPGDLVRFPDKTRRALAVLKRSDGRVDLVFHDVTHTIWARQLFSVYYPTNAVETEE